ncbi:amidohydrolase [Stakelama saccharophila]|uniref:Amidohydrolase n=1 Tax=Stakelama saccharophila TaxID=3075605 RepID=A0ABZ0B9N7_9SPHN|nr:amidohydrolase [Stakelama sp. W311]WNO54112.1 amidohydrolase [Stakelama sp. W311]
MIDRRTMLGGAASLMLLSRLRAQAAETGLDAALVNGSFWTGVPGQDGVRAIGISGDRIAAIGDAQVRSMITRRTRVIDLDGAFAMPALTDGHTHFLKGSHTLTQPDLLAAHSRADFAARIGAAARKRPGKWITGGAWDEQRMGGDLPTHDWIDAVTPDTPVAVPRTDLHSYLLNAVAMKLAGITRDTPDPDGGVIVRDADGEPTGIVKDNAKTLVERVIPPLSDADAEAAVRRGIDHGLSKGLGHIHNPEINWDCYPVLRRLREKGETDIRFYAFVPITGWEKMAGIVAEEGRGDDWLRWGAVKALADGSLGSRTALFYDDYSDASGQRGVRVTPLGDLHEMVRQADAHGLHVATHAIGDRANDDVLDVYAAVAKANGPKDRRFRVEHAQHLRPESIKRFAEQGVIASVQPYHAIDDGRWAVKRIGEKRLEGTYAFRSLIESGAHVAFGSDWPVAPLDPLTGIYAGITRRTIDGKNPDGWLPDQKVTAEQALTAYTRGNAYSGFIEDRSGILAPGYYADIAVFDGDLLTIDPLKIPEVKTLHTFVGGKQRYTAA